MITLQWSSPHDAQEAFILERARRRAETLFDNYSKRKATGYSLAEVGDRQYVVGHEINGEFVGYRVEILENVQTCECPFFLKYHCCKHQAAVVYWLNRQTVQEEPFVTGGVECREAVLTSSR